MSQSGVSAVDSVSIQRIVISRLRFIGDVILTTPLLGAVREKFPGAHIAYLADAGAVRLLEHNPNLNELIAYDFSRPDILEQLRITRLLRSKRFDVFVDLFSNPRSALLAFGSGARIRIGKEVPGRGKFFTHRIGEDGKRRTAVEFHYRYLEPLGIAPSNRRTEIFLTEEEKREARIFLKWQGVEAGSPIVGVHPGATWPAKMWRKEHFASLVDLLNAKLGAQVVITQGPNDAKLTSEISSLAVGKLTVLDVLPLRQLAAVLSQLTAYVSNDAGPMHMAVAVGTPTVGLFGPGEEDIWFPYVPPFYDSEAGHAALRHDVYCHPCHLDFCDKSGSEFMACMQLLSPSRVLKEIERILNR